MLGKMIVQGLVAAILIGAGAAAFAQAKGDNASLDAAAAAEGNGYLTVPNQNIRKHDETDRAKREDNERHQDGRKQDHDNDDD